MVNLGKQRKIHSVIIKKLILKITAIDLIKKKKLVILKKSKIKSNYPK